DEALASWGWPVGPLMLTDEIGIDVAAHVGKTMLDAFGDRVEPSPVADKLARAGRKGRKNEKGFYLYGKAARGPGGAKKRVDPTIYEVLGLPKPTSQRKLSADEIQFRCSLQFVNEAVRCYGERILRSARDGDVGAVFGLGFPPFRGGPFRFV